MHSIDSTPLHLLASYLYRGGIGLRNAAFDAGLLKSEKSQLPSICVGNVVVGGSGKTPFTQYLVQALATRGHKPAVLLRGYKGTHPTPYILEQDSTAEEVGDEALLHRLSLNASVPVVIAKNRLQGIAHLKEHTDANIVVLDDGLQHRWLEPSAGILLLNASSEEACNRWLSGKLLPYGHLREPISSALKRAHCVVQIIRCSSEQTPEDIPEVKTTLPVVKFLLRPAEFIDVYDNSSHPISDFSGKRADAAAAIADPAQFFSTLEALSISLYSTYAFADHHHFNSSEIRTLCDKCNQPLLTTEKDAVKLRPHIKTSGSVFMLKTSGQFISTEDETLFWQTTLPRITATQSI